LFTRLCDLSKPYRLLIINDDNIDIAMPPTSAAYTPRGVIGVHGSMEPKVRAGSRAQLRYGIASNHDPLSTDTSSIGLHAWDIALRDDTAALTRDAFIKDTELDMHDAVCHCFYFSLFD
jgi:hypothetical protein